MRYFIYCDESGESSFSDKTAYKYFSICTLTIDENKRNKIKNTMQRKTAKLYNLGWPKEIEIKASILHGLRMNKYIPQELKNSINGDDFIREILRSLKYACSPRIDYIIIGKEGLADPCFRNAPYGIAYNFFAGKVLIPIILNFKNCFLTIDRRNKEMHAQRHFDGYIETKARGDAFEKKIGVNLEIKHDDSQNNYGLMAVDFFSWGIYRKMKDKDVRFFEIFEDLVQIREEWYCF